MSPINSFRKILSYHKGNEKVKDTCVLLIPLRWSTIGDSVNFQRKKKIKRCHQIRVCTNKLGAIDSHMRRGETKRKKNRNPSCWHFSLFFLLPGISTYLCSSTHCCLSYSAFSRRNISKDSNVPSV